MSLHISSSEALDQPILPYSRSYWAQPGKLLAGFYPGNRNSVIADQKLRGLLNCRISCAINLMEANETNHMGTPFVPYEHRITAMGITHGLTISIRRFPIMDRSVPTIAYMREILDYIDTAIEAGEIVYLHCWGGIGRTGTVIGCHLVRHRIASPENVMQVMTKLTEHDRKSFRHTPETEEQRCFVTKWRSGQ